MPTCHLPYGRGTIAIDLAAASNAHVVETLAPRVTAPAADAAAEIRTALDAAPLPPYHGGGCAIAINDATRPIPHHLLLAPLLHRLARAGVPDRDIVLIIATGTHAVVPPEHVEAIVGPGILDRCRVICHDARNADALAFLGHSSAGTPIQIDRAYVDAALRVVVGAIEPHQFVGFSGGAKSAVIGLGGLDTIGHNHSMMTHPHATIGRCDDNPCRQDIDEIGARIGIHLALNVVLDAQKRIVRAFAGVPAAVMREGIALVAHLNQVEVDHPFDLLVASPGGHPKDLNLYQAQKALAHAALVARPGATILLAAACPDGSGSRTYEEWMARADMTSHDAVLARFAHEGYRIGPHKAFQISRDASRFRVLVHSTMPPHVVERWLLTPVADVQQAFDDAARRLPRGSRIGVMPYANATIPVVVDRGG